jgi:hypothetical protein
MENPETPATLGTQDTGQIQSQKKTNVNPVAREACSSTDTIEGFSAAIKSSTGRKWTT